MKRILMALIVGLVITSAQAQTDNPLKQGMPNTVMSNGEVIYDLNGEWDADDHQGTGTNIIRITQEGNNFEGILLIGKGVICMRGELERDGFKLLNRKTGEGWSASTGKIYEKCNKIVIKTPIKIMGHTQILTLTRK